MSSVAGTSNERRPDPLTGLAIQRKPIDRKHELCQRHIQQIFIRGEQVALVAVLPVWFIYFSRLMQWTITFFPYKIDVGI